MYEQYGKRIMDLVIALVALAILFPVMIVAVCVLTITMCSSPFFLHVRPGFKGKPFRLIKLKTMTEPTGSATSNLSRITAIGKFLRATSIDELPQLINVIKGDLSLVGPRPLEMRYLPHYSAEQNRRHDVKPGITGLAQINGRNHLSWTQKFKLDVEYVDNVSFVGDLKILLLTLGKVVNMGGVNAVNSQNTVEPFVPRPKGE